MLVKRDYVLAKNAIFDQNRSKEVIVKTCTGKYFNKINT